jgi:serine protease Do
MKPKVIVIAGLAAILAATAANAEGQGTAAVRGERLILEGPGSHIGASARDLEAADLERAKTQSGAVLESVVPDGPAARAGMQAGDVVTEFDGERVRSARHLGRLIRETRPDLSVKTTVIRAGRRTEISVTPTHAPALGAFIQDRVERQMEGLADRLSRMDRYGAFRGRSRLGAAVQELTPQLATYFGAEAGVLVESVNADSPAARAGLRAGDVITAVNGSSVRSRTDLIRELANQKGTVTIEIVRDKKASTVSATLEELRPIRVPGGRNL